MKWYLVEWNGWSGGKTLASGTESEMRHLAENGRFFKEVRAVPGRYF